MTLKIRLMTMMIILVMGVLALQFVLAEREKQELTSEIERLGTEVSSSARDLSVRAYVAQRSGSPLRDVLMSIDDSTDVDTGTTHTSFRYVHTQGFGEPGVQNVTIETDEQLLMLQRPASFDTMGVQIMVVEGPAGVDSLRDLVWQEAQETGHARRIFESPEGRVLAEFHIEGCEPSDPEEIRKWITSTESDSQTAGVSPVALRIPLGTHQPWVDDAGFALRFPIPFVERDSLHFVELSYPIEELTDRLAASRRRSIIWMASLLGVGVVGAALMAVQFTRPIRTLERSFRRVEEGDLDVTVEPGRDDEIGRLTGSFNHMVGRLRQSREMEERLRESERLATLGRLAAGVAHEVRNPLNAIKLTMQQLHDKAAPGNGEPERGDFERYYGTVSKELDRLEGVVGAFLDLTRSESLAVERMNVTQTVESSVELFSADAAARAVSLTVETPGPIEIDGDPARLTTVWNNLLSNALSHTPKGGRITVRVTQANGEITVRVADTGAGIPAEQLAHVFEPFYSGRSDGTGLGLGIVRSVVERHGGRVHAESTDGEGTTISVTLPTHGGTAGDPS